MNQLKEKMQELNMYRSLLVQQISTIKLLCTNKEDSQVIHQHWNNISGKHEIRFWKVVTAHTDQLNGDVHKKWHFTSLSDFIKYTKTGANESKWLYYILSF